MTTVNDERFVTANRPCGPFSEDAEFVVPMKVIEKGAGSPLRSQLHVHASSTATITQMSSSTTLADPSFVLMGFEVYDHPGAALFNAGAHRILGRHYRPPSAPFESRAWHQSRMNDSRSISMPDS